MTFCSHLAVVGVILPKKTETPRILSGQAVLGNVVCKKSNSCWLRKKITFDNVAWPLFMLSAYSVFLLVIFSVFLCCLQKKSICWCFFGIFLCCLENMTFSFCFWPLFVQGCLTGSLPDFKNLTKSLKKKLLKKLCFFPSDNMFNKSFSRM